MVHWIALLACLAAAPGAADDVPTSWDLGALDVPHAATTMKKLRGSAFKGALQPWPFDAWSKNDAPQRLALRAAPGGAVQATADVAAADAGSSDMTLQLNLGQFYSFLRQLPAGGSYEQTVRRLGLERLQTVRAEGRLVSSKVASVAVDLTGSTPERSVLNALGPPLAPVWPAAVPAGAAFTALSVQPSTMWIIVETVLAGLWPLEYSLAQVQIDQLEQQGGKRWGEDILGSTPRLWCAYELVSKKGIDRVAVLEVADGIAAAQFLKDALAVVADVAQNVTVKSAERGKVKTITVQNSGGRGVYLAFLPETIIVAATSAALDAHIAAHRKAGASLAAAKAVAYGAFDNAAALRQVATVVPPQKDIPTTLGRSTWQFAPASGGWHVDIKASAP